MGERDIWGVGRGLTTTLSQIPFLHFTNRKREIFGFGEGREIDHFLPCPGERELRGPQTQRGHLPGLPSSSILSTLCSFKTRGPQGQKSSSSFCLSTRFETAPATQAGLKLADDLEWLSLPPASTSPNPPRVDSTITMTGLRGAGDRTQGFLHARQALQPNYTVSPKQFPLKGLRLGSLKQGEMGVS